MLSPMNSASSKNEVSKSVDAVGLACGAVSEVCGGSVGAGFGSVATAVVSGSVVSVVVTAVVADVVTILTVVATVDVFVSVNDVFTGVVVSFFHNELSCDTVTSEQLQRTIDNIQINDIAIVLQSAICFILIYCPFDIYEECFCR